MGDYEGLNKIDVDTLTPQQLDDLRTILITDFSAFFEFLYGFAPSEHEVQWAMLLDGRATQIHTCNDKGQRDFCTCPISYPPLGEAPVWQRMMLMAPRNHSKTTVFSVAYPIWRIFRDCNVRIVLVSNTSGQAESFLRQISTTLEQDERLRKVFGQIIPTMPERWNAKEIIVNRTRLDLKDPTISTVGTGGAILSKRADLVICDDILNPSNTKTTAQREQVRAWFYEVLFPVLEPEKGQMLVVGTAWHLEDMYHQLMRNPSYDIRLRYDAILDEDKHIVLWPERFSWEELMKIKMDMGTMSFNKAYRNLILTDDNSLFKPEWIEKAKMYGRQRTIKRLQYSLDYSNWDLGAMKVAIGVDLAISQSEDADYTAFCVLGETRLGAKIPLWLEQGRMTFAATQEKIIELSRRYNPDIIVVETNGYQEALRRDLADRTSLPIVGYTTGGEKFDPEVGIASIAVEFENEKWILPYPDSIIDENDENFSPYTVDIVDKLCQGFMSFEKGSHTDDIVMATWFANGGLRRLTYGTGAEPVYAKGGSVDPLGR